MNEISRRGFLGTALAGAVPLMGAAAQAQNAAQGVRVEKDVVFGKGGDMRR